MGRHQSWDLSGQLKLVDGTTATLDTVANAVTFANAIGNNVLGSASTAGLTKVGSGSLTMNLAATYTGTTTVNQGTLASTVAGTAVAPFGTGI